MITEPDIAILFARDPLKLTRENVDSIINHLRGKRSHMGQVKEPAAKKAKAPTAIEKRLGGLVDDIDIKI